jgi:hypothetical protein
MSGASRMAYFSIQFGDRPSASCSKGARGGKPEDGASRNRVTCGRSVSALERGTACRIFDRCEGLMPEVKKARAIGFNHIALEVGDIDKALAFYARIFELQLRGKDEDMAFIDMGDQFLALQKGRK